jgi:hypothetical protein
MLQLCLTMKTLKYIEQAATNELKMTSVACLLLYTALVIVTPWACYLEPIECFVRQQKINENPQSIANS